MRNNTAVLESYIKVDHFHFYSVHVELPLSLHELVLSCV